MIEEEDNNVGIDCKVRFLQDVCNIILVIRRGYILISLVSLSLELSLICLLITLHFTLATMSPLHLTSTAMSPLHLTSTAVSPLHLTSTATSPLHLTSTAGS